jgi:hypothetical protein
MVVFGMQVLAVLITLAHVAQTTGLSTATVGGSTLAVWLFALFLVFERMPGQRMSGGGLSQTKSLVPSRSFSRAYLPGSIGRSYFATNPRGYFHNLDPHYRSLRLEVYRVGNVARQERVPGDPNAVRVTITHATGENEWNIQLRRWGHAMEADRDYELSFRARADHRRPISFGITQAHSPWEGLGYYRTLAIDSVWTRFAEVFRLPVRDDTARLQFDLGARAISVELADVMLREVGTGESVDWANPYRYAVAYRFNEAGCRGAARQGRPRDEGARVLVLGGASVMGIGVHEQDTFAARLERLVNTLPGEGGARFEVINCAVPGDGIREQRLRFERLSERYRPDIVLVSLSPDTRPYVESLRMRGGLPVPRLHPSVLSLRLVQSAIEAGERPGGRSLAGAVDDMRVLFESAARRGIRVAAVMFRLSDDRVWDDLRVRITVPMHDAVPVLDVGPALRARHAWAELVVDSVLDPHPNEIAHRIAADTLLRFLIDQRIVTGRRAVIPPASTTAASGR